MQVFWRTWRRFEALGMAVMHTTVLLTKSVPSVVKYMTSSEFAPVG